MIAVSMNHSEEIHHHHTPSSKLFWNLDVGFQFWELRIMGCFYIVFQLQGSLITSPCLTPSVAARCIQNKEQNSEQRVNQALEGLITAEASAPSLCYIRVTEVPCLIYWHMFACLCAFVDVDAYHRSAHLLFMSAGLFPNSLRPISKDNPSAYSNP